MSMVSVFRRLSGVVAMVCALAVSAAAAQEATQLNLVSPDAGFSDVWRAYPDMDATFARDGTPRTLQQVRRVSLGNTKAQLVRALGRPVSANPDGSWNFDLKLQLPQRNRLVCQYMVFFDDAERVQGTVWRRPQCAGLVTGKGN